MKQLRRVFLEQEDKKPFLKGSPEQQAKRAEILKRTKQVKAERNARAARTGGSGTSRPGYSSVSDSIVPLTASRVNEVKRMPGTGPHVPASDRPGAAKRIMKDKLSGKRPQTPVKPRRKPGSRKLSDGSTEVVNNDGEVDTVWGGS